ncbi:MAG TPA: hypothetical protein PKN52_07575 [Trueperaceae bacterium]|nr:hypothetical protein [Trueperaceae bacterium]
MTAKARDGADCVLTEDGEPESQKVEAGQVAEQKRARTLAEAERRARLAS